MDNKGLDNMDIASLTFTMVEVAKNTVQNEEVQKLLNNPKEHFDVVIVEWLLGDVTAG